MQKSLFIEKIEKILKDRRIKKNKFALDCGFSVQSLIDWERRSTIPSGDVVYRIAKYLKISIEWLLNDEVFLYIPNEKNGFEYTCNASEIMYRIDSTIQYQQSLNSYEPNEVFYSSILDIISMDEIYSYSNNFAKMPTEVVIKIAERLAVSYSWLSTGKDLNALDQSEPFVIGLAAKYNSHLKFLHCLRAKSKQAVINLTCDLFHSERLLREELQANGIDLSNTSLMKTDKE
jgi:transcriptional regulator with XRE-family HTH domain